MGKQFVLFCIVFGQFWFWWPHNYCWTSSTQCAEKSLELNNYIWKF